MSGVSPAPRSRRLFRRACMYPPSKTPAHKTDKTIRVCSGHYSWSIVRSADETQGKFQSVGDISGPRNYANDTGISNNSVEKLEMTKWKMVLFAGAFLQCGDTRLAQLREEKRKPAALSLRGGFS